MTSHTSLHLIGHAINYYHWLATLKTVFVGSGKTRRMFLMCQIMFMSSFVLLWLI